MVNKPLLLKLLRDLWQRCGAILALIMIIAVGVCCYVGMAGVYQDLNNARVSYYHKYNLADFTIDLKRAPEDVIYSLTNLPNVLRLRKRIMLAAMVELPRKSYSQFSRLIPGEILSLPVPQQNLINNVRMVSGTWFSSPYAQEVIVDQQFATARHLQVGDTIQVRLPDQEHNLLIVGTVTSPEFTTVLAPGSGLAPDPGGYAILYMPFRYFQQCADLNGSFNQLLGMVRDSSQVAIQNTMDLLGRKLDSYGVLLKTAQQDQTSVKVLHDELVNIQKTAAVLPTMFFLVAILVLNVMLTRLIAQQRNLIGTLKALGYGSFAIMRHYLGFGLVVGLLGGLVGCSFGYWLQYLLLTMYKEYFAIPNMVANLHYEVLAMGILLSVISAVLGAVFGARKATRLIPAEAMRPPAPENGVHIILEKFTLVWNRLSFRGRLIARAIFRNKTRSLVTIGASILATALVFVALEFVDAMYEMIDFSFATVQHQDYIVTLRDPLGEDILRTVSILPGVKTVEGQLNIESTLQHGAYIKNMAVTGLPADNELYTPVDQAGHRIIVPKAGLVINRTLANILQVKEGDYIKIRPLLGERKTTEVQVTKIIRTYLGLAAYANQNWLSRLMGDSYLTNTLLFKLQPNANSQLFLRQLYRYAPLIDVQSKVAAKQLVVETFDSFMLFMAMTIIVFAAIIAVGSIINTAIISFSERERDVASLRLLGFTVPQTARIFFDESVILNCIGIFFGIFMGIYFAYYTTTAFSTDLFRMPMVIRGVRMVETALLMFGFILLSQAIVYLVISRLKWFSVLNTNE